MSHFQNRAALALIPAALLASHVADSLAANETTLPQLVVTANRQPTRADHVLADVSVLSREDIETAGVATLEQLLATQPGVEYSSTGGRGQPANIFLRGANGNHTLVLLDGMRINSATLGAAAISTIPLSAIERIEILRGPASSLYGADAIGGVIQIFTRQAEGAPRFSASYGVGNRDTSIADFATAARFGDLSLTLNGSREHSASVSSIRNPDSRWAAAFSTDPYNADRDGYQNDSLNAQARYRLAPGHELGMNLSRYDGLVHKDATQCDSSFSICTSAFDSRTRQIIENTGLFWSAQFNEYWTSTLRLGLSKDDQRDYRLDPATLQQPKSKFVTTQDQWSWQNDIKIGTGTVLLAAEEVEQKIDASSTYVNRTRSIHSLLAGYSAWYGVHGIQANLRRDSNAQFGNQTTGGISYAYQLTPAWRVQGGANTAFKAPSFNDLYFPVDPAFGGGNANLKPEKSRSVELGTSYRLNDHRFSLTLYRNAVSNLIQWAPDLTVGPFYWIPQNISQALLRGATFTYDGAIADWCVHSSIDLQNPINVQNNDLLDNRARSLAKLQLSRQSGPWNLGVGLVASGIRYETDSFGSGQRNHLGGYTLANVNLEYSIDPQWKLVARAQNLFDKKYELRSNYGTEGVNYFVGLRYTMK